ncbi:MAG: hypothetical protein HQK50_03980 [Oligoflexia bacterium]|nr:hypothetical protein [Oligoflexia bacterium]
MRDQKNSNSSNQVTATRACQTCGEIKVLTLENFYFKNDRNDFDKTCISCRKKSRQNRYRSQTTTEPEVFPVPQPEKETTILPATVSVAADEDFDDIDMSDLFDFFKTLKTWRDEYKKENPNDFNENWEVLDEKTRMDGK